MANNNWFDNSSIDLTNQAPEGSLRALAMEDEFEETDEVLRDYFLKKEEVDYSQRIRAQGQTLPAIPPEDILEIYSQLVFNLIQNFRTPKENKGFLGQGYFFREMPFSMEEVYNQCTHLEVIKAISRQYSQMYRSLDKFSNSFTLEEKEVISSLAQSKIFLNHIVKYCIVEAVNRLIEKENINIVSQFSAKYAIIDKISKELNKSFNASSFSLPEDEYDTLTSLEAEQNALMLIVGAGNLQEHFLHSVHDVVTNEKNTLIGKAIINQAIKSKRGYKELFHD